MSEQAALQFVIELRRRIIFYLFSLLIVFAILFSFANQLYRWLALPLLKQLPQGHGLISTNIVAPFFVPFELALVVAIFITIPVFLYQLWAFIAPALYHHEKKLVWPLLVFSCGLFYIGVAFAYWIIFPVFFHFIANTAPPGVLVSPDITHYLDFTLKLFLVFGAMFELPVVMVLLVWTQVVTRSQFINIRSYAIVIAFVMGMLLAPPDVLSQTLFAIPLWILFEMGVFFSRFVSGEKN